MRIIAKALPTNNHSWLVLRLSEAAAKSRRYSTPTTINSTGREETVTVKLGRYPWPLRLLIRHASRIEPSTPIIIYLQRGIPSPPHLDYIGELASSANATVVQLEHNLNSNISYPLPVHMVLAFYDWVQKTFTSNEILRNDAERQNIGVCGELVGGSLATMLALTECQAMRPGSIKAAAVGNPTLDWTALFPDRGDSAPSERSLVRRAVTDNFPKEGYYQALSLNGLLSQRDHIFKKPERFFDPFASPLLFFRTPSYDLPYDMSAFPANVASKYQVEDENSLTPTRKRCSHRRYPPAGSSLHLPPMRVEVGEQNVLKYQGRELVELMRKSDRRSELESVDFHEEHPKGHFEYVERKGLGLWSEKEVVEIGKWFGEVLRLR